MNSWHGYVLFVKPLAWSMAEWQLAKAAIFSYLDADPESDQPAKRLHYRTNLADDELVVEANFVAAELNSGGPAGLAAAVAAALGVSTPTVIQDFKDSLTIFGNGMSWKNSGDLCRAYIEGRISEWDLEVEI